MPGEGDRWVGLRRRLMDHLRAEGYISTSRVYEAMMRVPRELFVPEEYRDQAYDDKPLPIGYGQTISAPSVVAYMTELLDLGPGMKVLEVGAGSGYQAAVLAELAAPLNLEEPRRGHVYTIERIPELAEYAKRNLERAGYAGRVTVIVGDGSVGYEPSAPYDRIIVTAAAPRIPEPLLEQLRPDGVLVIPIGGYFDQVLYVVRKTKTGGLEKIPTLPVIFVPLIGRFAWGEKG